MQERWPILGHAGDNKADGAPARPWLTLMTLCTAVLIAQLDTSVVNLAVQPIGEEFHASVSAAKLGAARRLRVRPRDPCRACRRRRSVGSSCCGLDRVEGQHQPSLVFCGQFADGLPWTERNA